MGMYQNKKINTKVWYLSSLSTFVHFFFELVCLYVFKYNLI